MLSDIVSCGSRPALQVRHSTASTLLVDRAPTDDFLINPSGSPVWPIRSEDDWGAVSNLCQLRSISIKEVRGSRGELKRADGVVVGIGDAQTQKVAQLYAHLTGRRFEGFMDSGQGRELSRASVIVTSLAHLTSDLLCRLYSTPGVSCAPGLICAANVEDLRRQALVRSIAARRLAIEEAAPWTAVFPTEDLETHLRGRMRVFGARSSPRDVRNALTARSGLLTIATHCDGVDAFLGRSLTLCAMGPTDGDALGTRAPSCSISGFCHRHSVQVAEFLEMGVAIAPAEISAGVLLLDTCFGVLAADAPIDAERALGRYFIDNLAISAVATTWELTLLDPGKLAGLVADLSAGLALGRAVARFNRSLAARRTAARLAVFGDPLTRVAERRRTSARTAPTRRGAPPRQSAAASAELRELGFSRACLEHGVAALSAQLASCSPRVADRIRRQLDAAENALARLGRHERSQWLAAPDDPADAAHLRLALIEDAFIRRPMDDWKVFAEAADWSDHPCSVCGAPARVAVLKLRVPGVSRRRVVLCPHCGVSEDMPEHVRIVLQFHRPSSTCSMVGALPAHDWSAALIVRTRIEATDRIWPWPAAPDGEPCERMQLPEPLPQGPLKLAVIIIHQGWTAWTACDIHGAAIPV